MGVARVGAKLARHFALYISETQDQADKHVSAIGGLLETVGVERKVNQYQQAKGWKANLLRTADDFNVMALGLDSAARGVKLDQFRPDLIIFDDIDNQSDSFDGVEKKIHSITNAILPAGSPDCAVLFAQNKIHRDSIMAMLCDNRADFLLDRDPARVVPAVRDLVTETVQREGRPNLYRIVGGTSSWTGRSLEVCEKQINTWGLKSFLIEAQHEVETNDGVFFRVNEIKVIKPDECPPITRVCLAWDLAATEGAGDHTVGFLLGLTTGDTYVILAVVRGQWSSERVRQVIQLTCEKFLVKYSRRSIRFPQDPGQAGKDQIERLRERYRHWGVKDKPISGDKADRASSFAEAINLGNVSVVEQDLPSEFEPFVESTSFHYWWPRVRSVFEKFREGVRKQADDDVDAGADAFNELASKHRCRML